MTRKEKRIERAVRLGREAFENSFNCAQSTMAGLMREFLLPRDRHRPRP